MVEIVNRQRRRAMDCERWSAFAGRALKSIGVKDRGATIAFVSDRAMRDLNRRFRGRAGTTDVLSFPAGPDKFGPFAGASLGDVVISVERAARQAFKNELDFEREIAQLILHGLLHLCGYDHETDEGQMNARELRLRRRLGI